MALGPWPGLSGLSPLARGNLLAQCMGAVCEGPIPARAGQPWRWRFSALHPRAYPRSRGATPSGRSPISNKKGLSPLARGNLPARSISISANGPIPARAGQPGRRQRVLNFSGAYPRSRGATGKRAMHPAFFEGLSPLARGNPTVAEAQARRAGPIPARAGQPPWAPCRCRPGRAYPRSRGATF